MQTKMELYLHIPLYHLEFLFFIKGDFRIMINFNGLLIPMIKIRTNLLINACENSNFMLYQFTLLLLTHFPFPFWMIVS